MAARPLLRALRWPSGHRLHVDVTGGLLLVTAASDGTHVVGARGALPLPAAARQMCGIQPHQVVLLAAIPARALLVVHPSIRAAGRLAFDLENVAGLAGALTLRASSTSVRSAWMVAGGGHWEVAWVPWSLSWASNQACSAVMRVSSGVV